MRHRFFLFGTYTSKVWKLVFSPFVTASSGVPFNITTGVDSNLDRAATERPSFAGANPNCSLPNIRCTAFGNFNLTPAPGEQIIPRNFGQGPSSFTVNLRITRSFGFGNVHKAGQSGDAAKRDASGPRGGAPGARGPMIAGGGGGGGEGKGPGGGGGGMGQGGPGGGGGSAEKKYNVTASLYFQNLFNNVNLSAADRQSFVAAVWSVAECRRKLWRIWRRRWRQRERGQSPHLFEPAAHVLKRDEG